MKREEVKLKGEKDVDSDAKPISRQDCDVRIQNAPFLPSYSVPAYLPNWGLTSTTASPLRQACVDRGKRSLSEMNRSVHDRKVGAQENIGVRSLALVSP